jgi:hypothetical protein
MSKLTKEEEENIVRKVRNDTFVTKLAEYAMWRGLSVPHAVLFSKFYLARFERKADPHYWDDWINRFKKGFQNVWTHADGESRYFLAREMFRTLGEINKGEDKQRQKER